MNQLTRATAVAALALAAAAVTQSTAPAAADGGHPPADAPARPTFARAPAQPAAPPPADPADPGAQALRAFDDLTVGYANDSGIGRTVGTVVGLAAGCGLGAITGGTLTSLVSAGALTPLGALGGCMIGGGAAGFWASTLGGAVTGLPSLAGGLSKALGEPGPPAAPADTLQSDLRQAVSAGEEQSGLATSLGVLAGSAIGMVIGCPLGAVTGGGLSTVLTAGTLTLPVAVTGCILGGSAIGGFGALLGGAALAIPIGVAAGVQTFTALRAAHTHSPNGPAATRAGVGRTTSTAFGSAGVPSRRSHATP